jgi:hypothetical protein
MRPKGKYLEIARAVGSAKQFFKGPNKVNKSIKAQVRVLGCMVKNNLKETDGKFVGIVDEAEKEFEEYLKDNLHSNKFHKDTGKQVTYLLVRVFYDKVIDKISYAISLEEPNFDMGKFRRQCETADWHRYCLDKKV